MRTSFVWASAIFLCTALVADAACPVFTVNGQKVDLSALRPSVTKAKLSVAGGTAVDTYFTLDLCNSKPPAAPGTTSPCVPSGFIEVYNFNDGTCVQTFDSWNNNWEANGTLITTTLSSPTGATAILTLTCGNSVPLNPVGEFSATGSGDSATYNLKYQSSLTCLATNAPPTPAPPAPIAPQNDNYHYWYYAAINNTYMRVIGNVSDVLRVYPELVLAGKLLIDQEGMLKSGWDTFDLEIVPSFFNLDPSRGYFAAGFIEGAETQHRMWQNFYNMYPPDSNSSSQAPPAVQNWIEKQWSWLQMTSATNRALPGSTGKFWGEVYNTAQQMLGMMEGYQSMVNKTHPEYLSAFQIYLIGFAFELSDVQFWAQFSGFANNTAPRTFKSTESGAHGPILERKIRKASHCSALVKVTDDDLFMGHNTWSMYLNMLRQFKVYRLGNSTVSMSSYPGTLHSGDDWYITSHGLTTQETTLEYNPTPTNPADKIASNILNQSVPEWIRVMVANRLATTAPDWTTYFCMQNSGTYNNQYMVVDMKLFNPSGTFGPERLPDNTFNIVEQMPGYCIPNDATSTLRLDGYWASYNLPAIPLINEVSGNAQLEEEYGDFFSHHATNRAEIFRKRESKVTDMASMMELMRYNNFRNDPLSNIQNCTGCPNNQCVPPSSATLTIAARGDLDIPMSQGSNKTRGPLWAFFTRAPFGAIDAKVVSYKTYQRMEGLIVSGPTVEPQYGIEAFSWTQSGYADRVPHEGMPDSWDFAIQNTTLLLQDQFTPNNVPTEPAESQLWIVGVIVGAIFLIIVIVLCAVKCKKRRTTGEGEYEQLDEKKGGEAAI